MSAIPKSVTSSGRAQRLLSAVSGETDVEDITPHIVLEAMRYAAQRMSNAASNAIRKLGCCGPGESSTLASQCKILFVLLSHSLLTNPQGGFQLRQSSTLFWMLPSQGTGSLQACLHTAARKSELFRLKWSDRLERGHAWHPQEKRRWNGV